MNDPKLLVGAKAATGRYAPLEQVELTGADPREGIAHIDGKVTFLAHEHFSTRCLLRLARLRAGGGEAIGLANAEKHRAADFCAALAGRVAQNMQRQPRGNLVVKGRLFWLQGEVARFGVCRRQQRG